MRKLVMTLAVVLFLGTPAAVFAQAQGSITGVVRDTSGGVLPGVTVEASSPALIEKARTVVTDGTGQYRFINLFPGTYTVTFTLPGFNVVRREGIQISGSFVATINADMQLGSLEETITVTGETSTVDVQSTTRQRVMDREVIDAVPTSRVPYQLATLVPGVTAMNGAGTALVQDVGGSAGNQQANSLVVHGSKPVDMRLTYNGLTLATLETGKNAGAINNSTAYQEVTIDSSAVSAELSTGGVRVNLIPREGGNRIQGTFFGSYTDDRFQGNNYSDELRDRGLRTPNEMKQLWDLNPGIGGPIVRDKLWFYGTIRHNGWQEYIAGMYANANAGNPNAWTDVADIERPAHSRNVWKDLTARLTWQASPRNKIGFGYNKQQGKPEAGGGPTISPESSISLKYEPKHNMYLDWTAPLTNRLLLEVVASEQYEGASHNPPLTSLISVTEQSTGLTYRGVSGVSSNYRNHAFYYRASLAYVTGAHNFKVGFNNAQGFRQRRDHRDQYEAPLAYRFNNGVPNQITLLATPWTMHSNLDADAGIYAQDRWTVNRLTVSAGARYDYYKSSYPDQAQVPGALVPTRNFVVPAQDGVRGWHDITPKSGVSYDLFGNGRTAVKATLNKYVQGQALGGDLPDRPFGSPLNPVYRMVRQTTRSWNDANRNFTPDCNLTLPAANGECGAMANSSFGQIFPDTNYDPEILGGWGKRAGHNWEMSAGVQHEIVPRVSVDVAYFRRWYGNLLLTDNLTLSPADYDEFSFTAPSDSRLPDGGGYRITGVYDLNPTKFGLPANNLRTYSDKYGTQTEHWNGFDISSSARLQNGVLFQGGISTGKTTTDSCDVVTKVDNPSSLYCHVETPFLTQVKALVTYTIPRVDVQIAGTFQSLPGPEVVANFNVPTAVAAQTLGRPLSGGAANVTVNLIEPGSMYGDRHNQFDLRFGKVLRAGTTKTALNVDLYNAFNANPVTAENPNYAAFRRPTAILPARFLKFAVQFDF